MTPLLLPPLLPLLPLEPLDPLLPTPSVGTLPPHATVAVAIEAAASAATEMVTTNGDFIGFLRRSMARPDASPVPSLELDEEP